MRQVVLLGAGLDTRPHRLDLPAGVDWYEVDREDWCEANEVPPPFGADDPSALLQAGGWHPAHVTAPGAADANYGRLPTLPGGLIPGRTHLVTGRLPTGS